MSQIRHSTMIDYLLPLRRAQIGSRILLVLFGSLLLAGSAKISLPMWPVPMTMQSLVVLMIGMAYGARLGAATVAIYLLEGLIGLPVFAGTPERGIGMAYMVGPTGGYLAGFLLAAATVGALAERGWDRGFGRTAAAMAIGTVLLFIPGVAWLAVLIGPEKAIEAGLVPFLSGSVIKGALGTCAMPLIWQVLTRR